MSRLIVEERILPSREQAAREHDDDSLDLWNFHPYSAIPGEDVFVITLVCAIEGRPDIPQRYAVLPFLEGTPEKIIKEDKVIALKNQICRAYANDYGVECAVGV